MSKNRYIIQYLDNAQRTSSQPPIPRSAPHNNRENLTTNTSWNTEEYYKLVFMQIDEDNDGFITNSEFTQGLLRGFFVSEYVDEEKLRHLFVKYGDKYKRLNFKDFYQMIKEINENYTRLLLNANTNSSTNSALNHNTSYPQNHSFQNQQRSIPLVTNNTNDAFQQQQVPIDDFR